jgi:uncharacterized membrane protein (UPF0182 family)
LIVMPVGRALLYAEPIYLQAEHSPMPELRLVVLALQDRLAYGPTFDAALAALLGNAPSMLASQAAPAPSVARPTPATTNNQEGSGGTADALVAGAAQDLAEYQRLTAEGKLGEAGQRLEQLKQKLDQLNRLKR